LNFSFENKGIRPVLRTVYFGNLIASPIPTALLFKCVLVSVLRPLPTYSYMASTRSRSQVIRRFIMAERNFVVLSLWTRGFGSGSGSGFSGLCTGGRGTRCCVV